MTAKTMAEVLADHEMENSPVIRGEGYTRCSCGFLSKGAYSRASHNRHVSDALSAAGFGLVTDAKAEVTTIQDLDALWLGSVVLSQGVSYQRYGTNEWAAEGAWYETTQVELPAAVLHDLRPANLRNPS